MLVQRELEADVGVADLHLGGEEERADRRGESGEEQGADEEEADAGTAPAGRCLVEPDGARGQAARGCGRARDRRAPRPPRRR